MPTRESQEVRDTDQARQMASGQLLLESRRPMRFNLRAPHRLMALGPGDDVALTHYGGPDAEGDGWGARVFDRGHCEIEGIGYDPEKRALLLGFRESRNSLLRSAWFPGTTKLQLGRQQDGEPLVIPSARHCYRPNVAYVADPGTGLVAQIWFHVPKLSDKGFLIERHRKNSVKDPCFRSGSVWSDAGTGTNGSATGTDTTLLLYAYPAPPDGLALVTDRATFANTGNPNTVDTYRFQTVDGALTNGNWYCLSVDHIDRDAVAPSVAIQLGANYWRASDQTWQGSLTWNQLTASGTTAYRRDKVIFQANAASAPTIRWGLRSTDGNDKRVTVAHVQLDMGRAGGSHPWPGSRISNDTAGSADDCEGDVYHFSNHALSGSRRLWPAESGTALWTLTPLWSSGSPIDGLTFTVFVVKYDANNEIKLFYDGTNGRFTFRRKSGGSTTDLNHTISLTADTPVTIELRWTSAYGELVDVYGAPSGSNRWFDMIVNGTRVAGAQSVMPVETADSFLVLGGEEAEQWSGYIKGQIVPYVLSENACAKWRLAA